MSEYKISFNKPYIGENELAYISDAVCRSHISGNGFYSIKCQEFLENLLGARKVLLTTSCTHALEMSAILMNIKEGDEVILPSFTFVSTANAFVLRGAKPVFADIRKDTLNIDDKQIPKLVTSRTKAIIVVHYAGVGCEMDSIMATGRTYNIPIIEDNAHGLFGKYKGRHLGTFGQLAAQSFHETKNVTCGEGGALIINDENLKSRAEIIREKGTNRSKFFRGEVDKYTWEDIGSSYLPSDILAAYLYAQLEIFRKIQDTRKAIWTFYYNALKDWASSNSVGLPNCPDDCEQSYHMFYLILPSILARQSLIDHLKSHGILSVFHYLPLHLSKMGFRFSGKAGDCPVAEEMSDRILRLPFYNSMTSDEILLVSDTVRSFNL